MATIRIQAVIRARALVEHYAKRKAIVKIQASIRMQHERAQYDLIKSAKVGKKEVGFLQAFLKRKGEKTDLDDQEELSHVFGSEICERVVRALQGCRALQSMGTRIQSASLASCSRSCSSR